MIESFLFLKSVKFSLTIKSLETKICRPDQHILNTKLNQSKLKKILTSKKLDFKSDYFDIKNSMNIFKLLDFYSHYVMKLKLTQRKTKILFKDTKKSLQTFKRILYYLIFIYFEKVCFYRKFYFKRYNYFILTLLKFFCNHKNL